MMKGLRTTAAIAFATVLIAGLCETSAMAVTFFPAEVSYQAPPGKPLPVDAFGYLGGRLEARFYEPHEPTDDPREEIRQAASLYGIDLPMMLSIARVESDFNPRVRTGSYKGLFQLSDYEFDKYGDGSVWDPRDNARAAAHMFLIQAEKFKWALGHFPDYAERYMVHQQGIEGAIEHYEHPERVAWQSMCATSEGAVKGERWCKRCIWGNLLPRWKHDFGSVEKISSGDFVSLWTGRINVLANKYNAVGEATLTDPPSTIHAPPTVIAVRSHPQKHRTAERRPREVVAKSKPNDLPRAVAAKSKSNDLPRTVVAKSKSNDLPRTAVAKSKPNDLPRTAVATSKPNDLLSLLTIANSEPTRAKPKQIRIATAAAERRRAIVAGPHRHEKQASAISR
jgi:predicted GIY-YIG superfamily endonuclease